jgi:acetylornithine/succinyldiaminopimelate/putrescine aminotransferase
MRQLFLNHLAQTSPAPMGLQIARAEGLYLYDTDGKAYLDLISGIGPNVLGHRHPRVTAAIHVQTDLYLHTLVYGEYVLAPQVQLATLLAQTLTGGLDSVYLTNSGAEATEGAMKLAKRQTGRTEFVACRNAYHGSTQGAASLMDSQYFTAAFRPLLPNIKHIRFNNEADLQQITCRTAAVVMEPITAESGIHKPENGYLKKVRERCDFVGAMLIFDEVQTGCGRTGALWAHQTYGITPDILLLAKGLGGGMPIGAFIAKKAVMQTLTHDPVLGHITTFGGHPLSAAAALATLQELVENKDLIANIAAKERIIQNVFQHKNIVALRTAGLWAAVELTDFAAVQSVIAYCLAHGVITDWFLFNDRAVRIAPPLTISEAELERACKVVLAGIVALGE